MVKIIEITLKIDGQDFGDNSKCLFHQDVDFDFVTELPVMNSLRVRAEIETSNCVLINYLLARFAEGKPVEVMLENTTEGVSEIAGNLYFVEFRHAAGEGIAHYFELRGKGAIRYEAIRGADQCRFPADDSASLR